MSFNRLLIAPPATRRDESARSTMEAQDYGDTTWCNRQLAVFAVGAAVGERPLGLIGRDVLRADVSGYFSAIVDHLICRFSDQKRPPLSCANWANTISARFLHGVLIRLVQAGARRSNRMPLLPLSFALTLQRLLLANVHFITDHVHARAVRLTSRRIASAIAASRADLLSRAYEKARPSFPC
jgi:hypothetical protein